MKLTDEVNQYLLSVKHNLTVKQSKHSHKHNEQKKDTKVQKKGIFYVGSQTKLICI